jgi:uracil DNA glycosylase
MCIGVDGMAPWLYQSHHTKCTCTRCIPRAFTCKSTQMPLSYQGWEKFTDEAICRLSRELHGIVFLLWGRYAQDKGKVIDPTKHHVLTSAHPS